MQTRIKLKKATFIFLYTLVFVGGVFAQDALLYEIPFKLPAEVNSEAEEAAVFVSPDGETLYFSRIMYAKNTGGEKGGQDIWSSSSDGKGGWYLAEHNLLTLNNKGNNAVIGVSEDGSMIYLLNKYAGKKTSLGVSFATKEGDDWSEPKALDIPGLIVNSNFYGFHMEPSGMFLILSMNSRGSLGQEDLYVSKNEGGSWTTPIHLGNMINTEGFEITPFLTADTKSLYFSTDSREGYGNADIYKSERLDDTWTNWSEPVNMGENINSAGFDAFFSITPGNRIFFCSNRSGMLSDVFESKVLERLVLSNSTESEVYETVIVQDIVTDFPETPDVELDSELTDEEAEVVEEVAAIEEESPREEDSPNEEEIIEEVPELEEPSVAVSSEEPSAESEVVEPAEPAEEAEVANSDVESEVADPIASDSNQDEMSSEPEEENTVVSEETAVEETVVEEDMTPEGLLARMGEDTEPVEVAVEPAETAVAEEEVVTEEIVEEVAESVVVEEVVEEPVAEEEVEVVEEVTEELVAESVIEEEVNEEPVAEEEVVVEDVEEAVEADPVSMEEEITPVEEVVAVEEIVAEEVAEEVVVEEVAEEVVVEEVAAEPVREVTPEPVINEEPLVSEVSARREVSGAGYVYFDHNSSYFNQEEAKKLKTIYEQLGSQPGLKLEVLGYSDNLGEEFYNMWISERRANRVIQYLVEKGIDESRMTSKWFGEANQASNCDDCDDQQNQDNRRVELILQ